MARREYRPRKLRWGIPLFAFLLLVRHAAGQGGPPMITDDPGTPGNGHWENNFAITFEHRPSETSYETPELDLNYGLGEHIQLTLQTAPVVLRREDHGPIGGLGGVEAAVKWRFLDEDRNGIDVSMFPRFLFNVLQSSVGRGLADDGTRFQLPFEAAKKFGRVEADAEAGPLISTVGRGEWLYGIVGGVDLSKTTGLMAELHGSARSDFSQDVLTVNIGVRYELRKDCIFIGSVGHDLRSPDALALIGYCGVQLLY
jgi:hypothetical protein